ncbi:hypothetical protein QBC44DRAFT_298901 [Cladorrhinum sp. PSN332]|nr:hypothetical protein QBC44DRAFT_298901 [Cladorrhinum sp. PSN332]
MRNNAREVQRRTWGIRGAIHQRPLIDSDWLNNFDQDVWCLLDLSVRMPQAGAKLVAELDETQESLDQTRAKLSTAETALDESREQVLELRKKLEEMEEELKSKQAVINQQCSKMAEDAKRITALTKTIGRFYMGRWLMSDQYLKGQVDNKRNVWRDMHPKQQAPHDKANVATAMNKKAGPNRAVSSYVPPRGASAAAPQRVASVAAFKKLAVNPTQQPFGQFGQSNLTGRSVSFAPWSRPSTPAITTVSESGSPSKIKLPIEMAMQTLDISADEEASWMEGFTVLFNLTAAFCQLYFSKIPATNNIKAHIMDKNKAVWDFMCAICRGPNIENNEAQVHVLLGDNYRVYFMSRIIVQYIAKHMLSSEGWAGFSDTVDNEMFTLNDRLVREAVQSQDRQPIVNRMNEIYHSIFSATQGENFKEFKLNHHLAALKKIISPFVEDLEAGSGEAKAHSVEADLKFLVGKGWELSARVWQSRLTFQYTWNDCGAKFSGDSHIAVNTDRDPAELMGRHARISLSITPAVMMRSDGGLTIQAKQILKSKVLTNV